MFEVKRLPVNDILTSAFGANAETAEWIIFVAAAAAFFHWVFTFGLGGVRHSTRGQQTQMGRRQAILQHWLIPGLRVAMVGCLLVLVVLSLRQGVRLK